jgi:hypothetical protein
MAGGRKGETVAVEASGQVRHWMKGFRMRFVAGLAINAAAIISGLAGPSAGATSNGATLKLTPPWGLTPGQTITVAGAGFPIKRQVVLVECPVKAVSISCNPASRVLVKTTRMGWFPPTDFTVTALNGQVGYRCGTNNANRNGRVVAAFFTDGPPSAEAIIHFART